jgi:hypothetical protein
MKNQNKQADDYRAAFKVPGCKSDTGQNYYSEPDAGESLSEGPKNDQQAKQPQVLKIHHQYPPGRS